jgi:integrase
MSSREPRTPKYRLHRASGRAVVSLDGRDVYLGKHGSPESRAEYDRVIGEWLARGRRPPTDERAHVLLKEVILGYFEDCRQKFPEVEVVKIRDALKAVRTLYGERPAAEFNAMAYGAVRQAMIRSGLCISTVRDRLSHVKRMLAWGIVRELISDKALNVIRAFEKVEPLRVGRSDVKASREVKPVPEHDLRAVLPHVPPTIAAMLMIQFFSGMRPGEVCRMTGGEIDRSGDIWIYRPARHKTAHLGKARAVPLGPQAQAVLSPWLRPDSPDLPLFRPETGYTSDRGRRPGRRHFRPTYTKNTYAQAVVRGCKRAGVPIFRPNRVRHASATRIRKMFGLEAAQVALGHSRADVTQIYAEKNLELAIKVAREQG